MSSHDHQDQNSNEPKAVSFTVPFILATVTLIIIFLFLSLCDPKKHGDCECKENCSEECMKACEHGDHSKHPKEVAIIDSVAVETKKDTIAEAGIFSHFTASGEEVQANVGGIEDQLLKFIEDENAKPEKTIWFDFDNLLFETGKATLMPESNKQLKNIAIILKEYPKVKIKIGAYTDNVGDSLNNVKLSQNRANSVLEELKKLKTNPNQIVGAEGYGAMHPVADNSTEEGRTKNRRVSINVREK